MKPQSRPAADSLDPAEIAKFNDLAATWWDANGPMAPLHRMTPCRMEFITAQIKEYFNKIKDLNILDIGCGGGIVAEPLSRLGAKVTGIDGAADLIRAAKSHAAAQNLDIDYRNSLTGDLITGKKKFDVILALEVIEHVPDSDAFVADITQLAKPNGLVIFSTLNRTPQSFALGIVAAEYLLRWLPTGTHDWKKFVKPSELHQLCQHHSLIPKTVCGMVYNPISKDFSLNERHLGVNYLFSAVKHGA
jgi:2-polyprenyl-6-hydroxyphenyl methylase/3-demethylubiquinone-9 3-methyltransferase